MLLVGILVKMEIAIALIELALLTAKEVIFLFFLELKIYPFGTAFSSNFSTLQSPLRLSPPSSTRLWKAGSTSPMATARPSSWLLLGWVADVFTSWLIFTFLSAICSLSREFFHELCGTLSSIVDSYSNIQVCTSFYILAPAAIAAAQPHAVPGWLSHGLFMFLALICSDWLMQTKRPFFRMFPSAPHY